MRRAAALLCIALVAGACGPRLHRPSPDASTVHQMELELGERSLRSFLASEVRLEDISYRLRARGAELCGEETSPLLGVLAWRRSDMPTRQLKNLAREVWELSTEYRVMHVVPGSAGERAGLKPGDEILSLGGQSFNPRRFLINALRDADPDGFDLEIERDGKRTLHVEPDIGCRYAALLSPSASLTTQRSASEDVIVPMGLVRIAQSDADLAQSIAHQMGHQIAPSLERSPTVPGHVLIVEEERRSREVEADRLALYLMARADYPLDGYRPQLERIAVEMPWLLFSVPIRGDGSYAWPAHGFVPDRLAVLPAHVEEIAERRALSLPLVPDRKSVV